MWLEWAADLLNLLGVLLLWTVLLPSNSVQWRVTFFGKLRISMRNLQLIGSFLALAAMDAVIEGARMNLQPRVLLVLLLVTAVLALFFRGFPLSFTIMHTFFAITVTEYLKILFRCFVPWEWNDLFEVILVNGSMIVCVILIQWIIRRRKLASYYYEHKSFCWIAMAVLGVPIMILAQFLQNTGREVLGNLPGMFMLLHFLLICLLIGMMIFYRMRQESQKIAANERYIQAMEAYVDSARIRAHDYRKHLNYLHNLVMTQEDLPELRREVQSYYSDLTVENQINDVLLHMDNPLLRALLYGQAVAAQRAGVRFQVSATPQLPDFPIQAYKMVEIFQNLMDNGMDAVQNLEEERRWVGVQLECERGEGEWIHKMAIENPIPDNMPSIAQMTQKNFTTKGVNGHQGLGLYQVSRLLEKNGGELLLEDRDGIFRVEVIFRVKEGVGNG